MRREQYQIKNAYRKPIIPNKVVHSKAIAHLEDETDDFDEDGFPIPKGISLMDPKVCSAILCNYAKLKEDSWDCFDGDTWYLINDFDEISSKALENYPLYERIVEYKIDGMQNIDI
jgi:antirestriction protein